MKLLLRRQADGIGDWLFCLGALRQAQRHHQDLEISIDFVAARPANTRYPLPKIIKQAFEASDLRYKDVTDVPVKRSEFDVALEHLVYDTRSHEPYLLSTCMALARHTGLSFPMNEFDFPRFSLAELARPIEWVDVTIQTHGKRGTKGKDYPVGAFEQVNMALKHHGLYTAQIAATGDRVMTRFDRNYIGMPFNVVAQAIRHSNCYIGIENGMSVLAAWLNVPHVIIYSRPNNLDRWKHARCRKLVQPCETHAVVDAAMRTLEHWRVTPPTMAAS